MIRLDENDRVQSYTYILAKKNHEHLGQLYRINDENVVINLNDANEISFTYYKESEIELAEMEPNEVKRAEFLWNELVDFKYIYVKELKEYFEINVTINDNGVLSKSIVGRSSCEAELSQVNVYGLEINTEIDILRDDYKITKFHSDDPKSSLLCRVLSFAPQYSVGHVDDTLMNLQRTFSFDDTDILSVLKNNIAEEFGCLFIFDTNNRTVSAYDLNTVCLNPECGHRGEFSNVCPKCGGTSLSYYGEDTTILVDTENLSDEITYETNVDSVKNCFKLVAGDDNMTAAIINRNPNGSSYIYHFSDEMKHEMPEELVKKIEEYDDLVKSYDEEYGMVIKNVYEYMDKVAYYTSVMMPNEKIVTSLPSDDEALEGIFYLIKKTGEQFIYDEYLWRDGSWEKLDSVTRYEDTTSTIELNKILFEIPRDGSAFFSVSKLSPSTSVATVNTYFTSFLKNFYRSGYFIAKVENVSYTYAGVDENGCNWANWNGYITMENSSNQEDVVKSELLSIRINDNYDDFVSQKVQAKLSTLKDEDGSIYDVLNIRIFNSDGTVNYTESLKKFKYAIEYYCLNRLTSFLDAVQGAIDIMIEENQANGSADLYNTLYIPYLDKLNAIQDEIDKRQKTIDDLNETLKMYQERQKQIQSGLNFEDYLGKELYKTFCCYKREQTYRNDNYISDGLGVTELFENAAAFIESASTELYKSGEYQHSIRANLYNLFELKEFEPLRDGFEVGNFIRIKVDDKVYRLRILKIEINFDSLEQIDIEFSDIMKINTGMSDLKSIIDSASSMASSYGAITNQMKSQKEQNTFIQNFMNYGLSATATKIVNDAQNQNVEINGSGISLKKLDVFTDEYENYQMKIINNGLYITDDNWKTVRVGLGRFDTIDPESGDVTEAYGLIANTIQGNLLLGENLKIYSEDNSASLVMDNDGFKLNAKPNEDGEYDRIFSISKDGTPILYIDENGNLNVRGNLSVTSGANIETIVSNVVEEEIDYFLISNKSTGVTKEDDGWETNMLEPTIQNPYLWTYKKTVRYNGETRYSEPYIIREKVTNNDSYFYEVISSNGNYFRRNNINTTLKCIVYRGNEDITDTIEQSRFHWIKLFDNGLTDDEWIDEHKNDGNEVVITPQDVYVRATFDCYVDGIE